jgi:hypothetical protein
MYVKWNYGEKDLRKEITAMAKNSNRSGRTWKNERASVTTKNKSRPKSNKYSRTSDTSKRPEPGSANQYWRAGYTRKDGTKVKGHYVQKSRP